MQIYGDIGELRSGNVLSVEIVEDVHRDQGRHDADVHLSCGLPAQLLDGLLAKARE